MIAYLGSWERVAETGQEYLQLEINSTDYRSNQKICKRHGGRLPEPRSNQDNEALRKFIASHNKIRLGRIRRHPDGHWTWENDGTNVTWTNWDEQPPTGTTEICPVLDHDGVWTPVTCGNSTSVKGMVICQGIFFTAFIFAYLFLNFFNFFLTSVSA